jgi:hypothetical protein
MKAYPRVLAAILIASAAASAVHAQAADAVVSLKVQVVISKYQGEKKTSSMPYLLSLNAGPTPGVAQGNAQLRMGTKVPIITTPAETPASDAAGKPKAVQYQDIGTNIDCTATTLDGGRFRVLVTVDDSSLYTDGQSHNTQNPTVRAFRAMNSMILKDGETAQFTAAVDKVSGEVTKLDITLTVVK